MLILSQVELSILQTGLHDSFTTDTDTVGLIRQIRHRNKAGNQFLLRTVFYNGEFVAGSSTETLNFSLLPVQLPYWKALLLIFQYCNYNFFRQLQEALVKAPDDRLGPFGTSKVFF